MSWWQFWKWGKEEKKSGMRIVLGGGNPPRTPALGKPTATNLVPPPVGDMKGNQGQGTGAASTTFSESVGSGNQAADDWFNKGNEQFFAGNLQGAIASYDKALEIKPDFHAAWNNRGLALGNLGRYEEAIASFDKAIKIKPDFYYAWLYRGSALYDLGRNEEAITSYNKALEIKSDDPEAWYNRGVALGNLDRYEEAISSYDQAIEIKPDNHEAWNNRGVALGNLDRYEESIASYDKALDIKPDKHEAWYHKGLAFKNLGRNEEAIASYDKALDIKPDNHLAWINRGIAVGDLSNNYRTTLGRPLSYSLQNPAIDQWGYSGEIANYRQGLEFCQQDTHPEGWGLLHWWMGRAHYLQGKKSDRSLFAAAREEYELALQTLTEAAFPEKRLEVFQDYVKLLWQLNQPNDVRELLQKTSELLQALIAKSPQSKERLERKFISFQQVTIDLCLQSGDIAQALVLAEQSKATCLSWMIATEPMDWQQIQNLVRADGGAFIYWYYSPLALHTILLLPQQAPHVETTPVDDLNQFLTTWNEQYTNYTGKDKTKESRDETWQQELPNHLTNLTEILSIEKILPILSKHNIQNLTLIPHRDLHRLPLHALFPQSIKTRYLPTLHLGSKTPLLLALPSRRVEGRGDIRLLSVEDPDSTDLDRLPHAVIESEYICQEIGAPLHRIPNEAATKDRVIAALQQGCQIFHFTGHAGYNFNSPKKSALCLAKDDRLTIEELVQISLNGCELVCLSACETGITGKQTITDEYVGLVSAFLAQGVGSVVSTLWQVNSASSAIFMMEFYRRKTQDQTLTNITALQVTTHWLRTATAQDLQLWSANLNTETLPRKVVRSLKIEIDNLSTLEITDPPYSHPYHWAAYTITGA